MSSLGFEPGSILAFQHLRTTDVATSRLPKKLGHWSKLTREAIAHHTVGSRNALRYSTPHRAPLDGFQGDEMTWLRGRSVGSTKDLGLRLVCLHIIFCHPGKFGQGLQCTGYYTFAYTYTIHVSL